MPMLWAILNGLADHVTSERHKLTRFSIEELSRSRPYPRRQGSSPGPDPTAGRYPAPHRPAARRCRGESGD